MKPVESFSDLLHWADKIVIGAGRGLSASAGLDYNDPEFFNTRYQSFIKKGIHTVSDAINENWNLTENSTLSYWGFWANHINTIYHETGPLDGYQSLYACIKDKHYFVITTNTDGQFFKGGFNPTRVFSPHGSYGKFQCQHGCHKRLYDNAGMVQKMLDGFDSFLLNIREEDVPLCPVCGGGLSPNLRMDHNFIDTDSIKTRDFYLDFLSIERANVLFLELGSGAHSSLIISKPFEEMTGLYINAVHVQVKQNDIQNFLQILLSS